MSDSEPRIVRLLSDDGQERLEIERVELGSPSTPARDDLLLAISASNGAYSASDQSWVVWSEWQRFLRQLRELERLRRGEAQLLGARPEDLTITFAAIDPAGGMSVSGLLGWERIEGFPWRLEFGFTFDPGMLATLLRELEAFAR